MRSPHTMYTFFHNGARAVGVFSLSLFLIYGAILFKDRHVLAEGYSDFVSLYTAGKVLQRGAPQSLYDLSLQYTIQREISPKVRNRQGALPFVRPAFEAWLFWPFAFLQYKVAFILWNLLSCACLFAALVVLRQEISGLRKIPPWLMLALGLSFFPVFFTILQGQDSLLLLLIYVIAFKVLRHGKLFVCGLILGLGIFKFPLVLPLLIPFAFKRQFAFLAGFATTCFALGTVSVLTVGWSAARYYPTYLLSIDSLAPGVNRVQDMTNLRGLLGVLLPVSPELALVVLLVLTVLALGIAVSRWSLASHSTEQAFMLGFALNVVTTILVSYHCHVFDLSILLLPMAVAVGSLASDSPVTRSTRLLTWLLGVLFFSPLYLVLTLSFSMPCFLALPIIAFSYALALAASEVSTSSLHAKIAKVQIH